jgi:hypothetical protein
MEKFIENQKRELLKNGAQDLQDEDNAWDENQEAERDLVEGEEDSLDDEDLAYITTILNSFSKPKLIGPVSPEGAPAQAPNQMTTRQNLINNLIKIRRVTIQRMKTSVTSQTLRRKDTQIWRTISPTKKTIVGTPRTSQVKVTPGANQTSRNLKIFQTKNTHPANLTRPYSD